MTDESPRPNRLHPGPPGSLDDLLPASDRRGRRFVALFLGLAALALAIHGGFNALVDPYDFYGSPLPIERALTVRKLKLELLKRAADPAPEALILGSSRVRMLDPRLAGRLFGARVFHSGGPVGGVADWLSFARYAAEELGYPVRLLLLGVDTPSFTSQENLWLHAVSYPELRRQLRHPFLTRARSMIHLWSPAQTRLSWERLALTGEEVRRSRQRFAGDWRPDGFRPRNPSLDAEQIFQGNLEAHRSLKPIEPVHLADFEALVDDAAERGITVVSFITPEAPRLRRSLQQTSYPAARERTEEILRGAGDRGVMFCDLDRLSLRTQDFVDPHHLSGAGGVKVLRALRICAQRQGWRSEAR